MQDARLETVLQKLGISSSTLVEKYTSGFINDTYRVGDFLIKIQRELDVLAHQPELLERARKAGAKVHKVIDYGVVDEKQYLVLEHIPGHQLTEDWLQFSELQKESFIKQIVEQLRIFHSIPFTHYSLQRPRESESFTDCVRWSTDFGQFNSLAMNEEQARQFKRLKEFFDSQIGSIDDAALPVLVYNDLHFNNILYQDDTITGIIDFDFARQAPREYELWHFTDFLSTPIYYVPKEQESAWQSYALGNEFTYFAKYYPELFAHPGLHNRLRLYLTHNLLTTFLHAVQRTYETSTKKFNFKFHQYFETDWLEQNVPTT